MYRFELTIKCTSIKTVPKELQNSTESRIIWENQGSGLFVYVRGFPILIII